MSTPLPPGRGGFHPFGSPDPSGFAAMACDELLVHGDDAARGLGVSFTPEDRLAADVLARLFPWHAVGPDDDPWQMLLWANGRIELPGSVAPAQVALALCATLSEWDGTALRQVPRTRHDAEEAAKAGALPVRERGARAPDARRPSARRSAARPGRGP